MFYINNMFNDCELKYMWKLALIVMDLQKIITYLPNTKPQTKKTINSALKNITSNYYFNYLHPYCNTHDCEYYVLIIRFHYFFIDLYFP